MNPRSLSFLPGIDGEAGCADASHGQANQGAGGGVGPHGARGPSRSEHRQRRQGNMRPLYRSLAPLAVSSRFMYARREKINNTIIIMMIPIVFSLFFLLLLRDSLSTVTASTALSNKQALP